MGVSNLNAEMLLANYFSAGMLAKYAKALGKSDKGSAATLAERIAREWAKPSFAPPASTTTAAAKRTTEAEASAGDEAEGSAKRQLAALEEIKAKRAAKAAQPASSAPSAAPTVDAATVDIKPHVAAAITELGLDDLSAKELRESVEAKLGLEAGALKPRRDEIKALVEAAISEVANAICSFRPTRLDTCARRGAQRNSAGARGGAAQSC